jgi:hypothetical protein
LQGNEQTKIHKINAKILLSAYLLKYHSEFVFIDADNQIKRDLIITAILIIHIIEHTFISSNNYKTFSLHFFCFVFNGYVINYKILTEINKQNLISELYGEYSNLCITKQYVNKDSKYDEIQKTKICVILDKAICDVKLNMRIIDKKIKMSLFDDLYEIEKKYKIDYDNNFWLLFENKIN